MRLNHVNLIVDDVPAARRFLERHYPKTIHIGFIQPSEANVNEIHERLENNGLDIEPPSRQHGARSFSFQAPGGSR